MKWYIDEIRKFLAKMDIHYEIDSFDSGAYMIDVRVNKQLFCLQLYDGKFGISQVGDKDEMTDFSTIPDKIFTNWKDYKAELIKVVENE